MRFSENRKLAFLILAIVVAASLFFGGGGALLDLRDEIVVQYSAGSESISAELTEMRQNADTMASIARKYDDANAEILAEMTAAIQALNEAETVDGQYEASVRLYAAMENCYSDLTGLELSEMDAEDVRYKYKNFNSALLRISHDPYNERAAAFNEELSRFPASLLGSLRGVKPLSLFR